MTRPRRLLALILPLAVLLAGCATGPTENAGDDDGGTGGGARADGTNDPLRLDEGFETGIDGWAKGSDPATATGWEASATNVEARAGKQSLLLNATDAPQDTVIWVARTMDVEPGRGYAVRMSAWTKAGGPETSRPAEALLYIGQEPPQGAASFDPANAGARHMALREPLSPGTDWREHILDWGTPGPASGKLHVAIGIDTAGAPAGHRFDEVSVTLTPM